MTTAYLTHDEVNAATARALADRLRFRLSVLDARQSTRAATRVVYDLDSLPPGVRADLLAAARGGADLSAVGAHAYHLPAAEARALRAAGAAVVRRLSARLLAGRPAAARGGCPVF